MGDAHDVRTIDRRGRCALDLLMAESAGVFTAPVQVTIHALPVVGPLEGGHVQADGDLGPVMAFPARGDDPGFLRIVMTVLAPAGHVGHVGVQTMGENHGTVKIGQLVDDDNLRPVPGLVLPVEVTAVAGAFVQAVVILGGIFALVAAGTGDNPGGRRGVRVGILGLGRCTCRNQTKEQPQEQ